jgi:hypothetical protein
MVIGEPVASWPPEPVVVGGDVDPVVADPVVAGAEVPLEHPAASSGRASAAARITPVVVRLLNILSSLGTSDDW